jgi:hypothetical protein
MIEAALIATQMLIVPPAIDLQRLATQPAFAALSEKDNSGAFAPAVPREFSVSREYPLSTGDVGEVFVTADTDGNGHAYFAINGDLVAAATVTVVDGEEPEPQTWTASGELYAPELVAELVQHEAVTDLAADMVPEEFKCSRFGRKVLKAAKYAMYGTATALTAACCSTVTPGCLVCAFGAGAGAGAIGDAFDAYCE